MWDKFGTWLLDLPLWRSAFMRWLVVALVALFCVIVIQTPFTLGNQLLFAALTFGSAYLLNRLSTSRLITLAMMTLSVVTTLRYMYWRVTETLDFQHWIDFFFGYGL